MKNNLKNLIVRILFWQSKIILAKYKPKIVAITGSVGKTSTKDAVFLILSKFVSVRKSDKSFNSEIGLPLTILGVPNGWSNPFIWIENLLIGFKLIFFRCSYPSWLVLEVGAGKPGDIKSVAPWICPDISIITHFPDKPVHVEFFKDANHIIEEKSALALYTKKDGIVFLNHDDEKVYALHKKVKSRVVSFGVADLSTFQIDGAVKPFSRGRFVVPAGVSFKFKYNGNVFPVSVPGVIGEHYASVVLSAIAVAVESGFDILESINAISEYRNPPGRMSVLEGVNDSFVIDDTYNSSPMAVSAALEFLNSTKANRRIAVLGDMMELGDMTEVSHREIGCELLGMCDILITVGPRSRFISEGAVEKGFEAKNIYNFDSTDTCSKFLIGILEPKDVVLVKGSQSIRLEKTVKDILRYKDRDSSLLCRQESEWQNR
jgi:UDP-N-acetylmuramoyl-tripeptide--D-alanyl-D-alanine ligase